MTHEKEFVSIADGVPDIGYRVRIKIRGPFNFILDSTKDFVLLDDGGFYSIDPPRRLPVPVLYWRYVLEGE